MAVQELDEGEQRNGSNQDLPQDVGFVVIFPELCPGFIVVIGVRADFEEIMHDTSQKDEAVSSHE